MTPFERNIEVWRQLWRVVHRRCVGRGETRRSPGLYTGPALDWAHAFLTAMPRVRCAPSSSDLLVQIVDARNPLLFRCTDLEAYVREVDPAKRNLLLINKADLLTPAQRYASTLCAKESGSREKERVWGWRTGGGIPPWRGARAVHSASAPVRPAHTPIVRFLLRRSTWADYFEAHGIPYVFWSAHLAQLELEREAADALSEEVQQRSAQAEPVLEGLVGLNDTEPGRVEAGRYACVAVQAHRTAGAFWLTTAPSAHVRASCVQAAAIGPAPHRVHHIGRRRRPGERPRRILGRRGRG